LGHGYYGLPGDLEPGEPLRKGGPNERGGREGGGDRGGGGGGGGGGRVDGLVDGVLGLGGFGFSDTGESSGHPASKKIFHLQLPHPLL
jgi:hypothetical protein